MRYYLSIETGIEVFNSYKELWFARGVNGIRANTMAEGIEKAIAIEKSMHDELYFIDIAAVDINYMPQLNILCAETDAPILIAASTYDADEHHKALNNGADFYGVYNEIPEQNINAVIATLHSIDRRAKKQRPPSKVLIYNDLLIAPESRQVFVKDKQVTLTKLEFDILRYLMSNNGNFLTHSQILCEVWGEDYPEDGSGVLRRTISRLRGKLTEASPDCDYIKSERDVGYKFST